MSSSKELRVNGQIRVKEVLLIDMDGNKVGVVPTSEALAMADEVGYDLVEISPNAKPPVCKIIDYGKFKFEAEKKAKEAKKSQQVVKIKEVQFAPNIDTHDYEFKLDQIKGWLAEGSKVKISVKFKGRLKAHLFLGEDVLHRYEEDLKECGVIEKAPQYAGKFMSMIVAPIKKK